MHKFDYDAVEKARFFKCCADFFVDWLLCQLISLLHPFTRKPSLHCQIIVDVLRSITAFQCSLGLTEQCFAPGNPTDCLKTR
jgi:hypothetical protein